MEHINQKNNYRKTKRTTSVRKEIKQETALSLSPSLSTSTGPVPS